MSVRFGPPPAHAELRSALNSAVQDIKNSLTKVEQEDEEDPDNEITIRIKKPEALARPARRGKLRAISVR